MTHHTIFLHDVLKILDEIAPFSLASAWDNVGLMTGDPGQEVTGLLVALDPTEEILEEAIEGGINTIITHHPLIFTPLRSIRTDQPPGRFLTRALSRNIAVVACHTNLDAATGGVNDVFAARLGLTATRPLAPPDNAGAGNQRGGGNTGFGRIGTLSPALTGKRFLERLVDALQVETFLMAGRLPEKIKTVAVCGGSGSDLAQTAFASGAQVYISGEIKHSTARWAAAADFCVIDAGHFATENLIIDDFAAAIGRALAGKNFQGPIRTAARQGIPFTSYQRTEHLISP